MRSVWTCLLAVTLVACAASDASALGPGMPSSFHAGATVDVNALGEAIVAWNGPSGVRAVAAGRAGGFGPTVQLSSAKDEVSSLQVAIDDRGAALVVWETSREVGGGGCSTCGPHAVSNGVWASLRRSAAGFGPAVALARARGDSGADRQLAEPRLAMSSTGEAVLAWSDAGGAMAASRSAGTEFSAPQRVAGPDFAVRSAAISADGESLLSDRTGRVAIRPAGGSFGAPALLPESASPYGPGALRRFDEACAAQLPACR